MGESLGALMGKVDLAELYEYPGKNIIVKIKVIIDVKNPLTTGIHIGNPVDGTNWIDYRYENLPLFASSVGWLDMGKSGAKIQLLKWVTSTP